MTNKCGNLRWGRKRQEYVISKSICSVNCNSFCVGQRKIRRVIIQAGYKAKTSRSFPPSPSLDLGASYPKVA